jgi:hypothetical protein
MNKENIITKQEFSEKLHAQEIRSGNILPGSKLSSTIISNGYNLYLALSEFTMMVPVVQNDKFFCDAPYKLVPNTKKIPCKVYNPQKDYATYKTVINYNTESYILEPIVPNGKGLYSRIEDLFKMDLIRLVGTYMIVIDCKNEDYKYQSRQVCYVIEKI